MKHLWAAERVLGHLHWGHRVITVDLSQGYSQGVSAEGCLGDESRAGSIPLRDVELKACMLLSAVQTLDHVR